MYTTNDVIKTVNKVFSDEFMIPNMNLKPDTNISDRLPLDSLDHAELIISIEEEFNIKISDSEASRWVTMQDIYKLVADKLGVE